MKITLLLMGICLIPAVLPGAYQYYYSDPLTTINTNNWKQNGALTATPLV
jgi:hypothetical protein